MNVTSLCGYVKKAIGKPTVIHFICKYSYSEIKFIKYVLT